MSERPKDEEAIQYIDLREATKDYQPKHQIPKELLEEYYYELEFLLEEYVVIEGKTGLFLKWLNKIIDKYIEFKENETGNLVLDITGSNTLYSLRSPTMYDFFNDNFEPQELYDAKTLTVHGNIDDFEVFYQYLKVLEFRNSGWIDFRKI